MATIALLTVLAFALVAGSAQAQPATTVQLPSFNFFSISTTVLVPDRGSVYIGGDNAGGAALFEGGAGIGQRSFGTSIGGGGMSVGVQVHDLRAMDRQLLDEAARRKPDAAQNLWADRLAAAKQSTAGRPSISIAEARRMRDADAVRR
jgi:hypothetical protein